MGLLVQKFGGTSVGTPDRIKAVAARIARSRREGNQLVVVVSAMGDTTDELIALAHQVSKAPAHREMDMLLTAGERVSMALLCMALADLGVPAVSFTGSQSGIITDQSHRRARIRRILGDRVRAALNEEKIAIVAGFQGVSETKEITTLGRGGSDTTAVALAAVLKADACDIFTDVDGVFTADPRIVPRARLWRRLPADLMVELASCGAGVLHPRSVELARKFGVVIRVRNSLSESSSTGTAAVESGGTEVIPTRTSGMEDFQVVGVTADKSRLLLRIELMRPGVINAIWAVAAGAHLSVMSPVFVGSAVQLFAERDAEDEWNRHLHQLTAEGFVSKFEFDPTVVPVSVVGDRFSDGSAISEVLETLARGHISVTMGTASALGLTVAVPLTHAENAVRALHSKFLETGSTS